MENVVKVILRIYTLPDPVSGHPIDLDRMLTHVMMGYETKTGVLFTCGPIDRLGVPHLAIDDHVMYMWDYYSHWRTTEIRSTHMKSLS